MERNKENLYRDLLSPEYNEAFMLGTLKVIPNERKVFFDYHFVEISGIKDVKPNCWVDLDSSGLKTFLEQDKELYLYIRSIFRGESKKDIDSLNITTADGKNVQVKVIVNDRLDNGIPKEIIAVFIDVSIIEKSVTELSKLEALFETSQQVSRASTWWNNYDEGGEYFYQTDNGALAAGLVPSKDKRYSTLEYGEMREKAAALNEDFRKAVDDEIASFREAWDGNTDIFGGRTPLMTPQGDIVWVDSRGKVVLRYEDGTPRFVVAVDIFINDVIEKEEELFKLQSIIDQGLFNSDIGVWWHDYDDGHFYFHQTESYRAVMGIDNLEEVDEDSKVWAEYIAQFKTDYPQYVKYLENDAELFRQCLEGEIDSYENIFPILSKGNEIIWIEVRATCITRNEEGISTLMVGVNVDVTDRLKTEEKVVELEKRNYVLNTANKLAIDTAKLLVWSSNKIATDDYDLFYANELYIETLGLPTYTNGLVSLKDFEKSTGFDEESIKSNENLRLKLEQLALGKSDGFEGVIVKHKNLRTNEIVYLEHNASIQQVDDKGVTTAIGGFIRNMTESILSQKEIETLNVQNDRLSRANSLANKSGQVLVWYQDFNELDGDRFFFGNDIFAKKLGLTSLNGFFDINEYRKTLYAGTTEANGLLLEFRELSRQLRATEIMHYSRVLVQHQNIVTGDLYYFEHYSEIESLNEDGSIKSTSGFLLDVTDNVQKRKQIEFLANRDILTGLYNRNFFENYTNQELPEEYSVLVFDLDGLKLINDTFGHLEGDKVIKFAAKIMKNSFEEDSVVCRTGGDEFILISTILKEEYILERLSQMREDVRKYNETSTFDIDLSYGYRIVLANETDFDSAFEIAENTMYKRKLTERRKRKSIGMDVLIKTLYDKTDESQEHTARLSEFCVMTMKELGFARVAEVNEMEILAKLHDIGKVTIPTDILFKKSCLVYEEYEKVKKHAEAGYKIIKNILDSDYIADGVLYHHERWDGTGYPMGLEGTEIPLNARIIAVCDAYEVMRFGRVYTKPISHEQAVKELRDCSGTQFDQYVVDAFIRAIERSDD